MDFFAIAVLARWALFVEDAAGFPSFIKEQGS
jgi:hypothetical protein